MTTAMAVIAFDLVVATLVLADFGGFDTRMAPRRPAAAILEALALPAGRAQHPTSVVAVGTVVAVATLFAVERVPVAAGRTPIVRALPAPTRGPVMGS